MDEVIIKGKTINRTVPIDKTLCAKCKYHSWFGGRPEEERRGLPIPEITLRERLHCYRSEYKHESCLKPVSAVDTYDIRGDGPGCLLFEEGKPKDIDGDSIREINEISMRWIKGTLV